MDKLLNELNSYVTKKYDEFKSESKTLGELKSKILSYGYEHLYDKRDKRKYLVIKIISDELMEMFDKELNEKTID